jgi:hypothetical protein
MKKNKKGFFVNLKNEKYKLFLFTIFIISWLLSGYHPAYPQDWLLENILVLLAFI